MTFSVTDSQDLNRFLDGEFAEPEVRVARQRVPDYRPDTRSVADIMASARPKILRSVRIGIKTRKFHYSRISKDQIRLLRIPPGRPDDPLNCELSIKRLVEVKKKYEALSYCWGNEPPSEIINIQTWDKGTDASDPDGPRYRLPQPFPIRPNLYKALRHLRSRERAVVVWVDAICIDQREEEEAKREKDHQLSMMSEIYNSAQNVCIWLGAPDPRSKLALDFVREIMDFSVLESRLNEFDRTTLEKWCDLIHTLNAPWFSRRWIIQEVASARNASVHFGDDTVHWDDLAVAISLLHEHHEALRRKTQRDIFNQVPMLSAVHLVKAIGNVCRKSHTGDITERLLDLETLVCTFQQFHASFSEDIIHSVRALAKDAPTQKEDDELRTNVEHKKSTRDLFIAFANRCIMNSNSLDIICRHWAPLATDTVEATVKLPSWISELSKSPFGIPQEFHERQNGENFVGMSPDDRRKRYNASEGYSHFNDEVGPDHRPRKSSIVPTIAISDPNIPALNTDGRFLGIDLLLSPLASPALEKERSVRLDSLWLDGQAQASRPGNGNPTAAGPKDQQPPEVDDHSLTLPSIQSSISTATLPRTPSPASTTACPGATSITSARSRAASISSPALALQSDKKRPHSALADIAEAATRSAKRRQVDPAYKRRQESYTQEDKEHNEQLSSTLLVHGLVLGTIKYRSDVMRGGIVPGDGLKKLGWDPRSQDNRAPESVWRTLVADRDVAGGSPPPWFQKACLQCLKDTRITNAKGDLDSHKVHKIGESQTAAYLSRVESVVWRRRIVEVEYNLPSGDEHLYGLVPEEAEEGDLVCILFGCSVPVVLRRGGRLLRDEQCEDWFQVVGESYIHGKMDGEAVQQKDLVNKRRRVFLLR